LTWLTSKKSKVFHCPFSADFHGVALHNSKHTEFKAMSIFSRNHDIPRRRDHGAFRNVIQSDNHLSPSSQARQASSSWLQGSDVAAVEAAAVRKRQGSLSKFNDDHLHSKARTIYDLAKCPFSDLLIIIMSYSHDAIGACLRVLGAGRIEAMQDNVEQVCRESGCTL
jgi:hypothetical protein